MSIIVNQRRDQYCHFCGNEIKPGETCITYPPEKVLNERYYIRNECCSCAGIPPPVPLSECLKDAAA